MDTGRGRRRFREHRRGESDRESDVAVAKGPLKKTGGAIPMAYRRSLSLPCLMFCAYAKERLSLPCLVFCAYAKERVVLRGCCKGVAKTLACLLVHLIIPPRSPPGDVERAYIHSPLASTPSSNQQQALRTSRHTLAALQMSSRQPRSCVFGGPAVLFQASITFLYWGRVSYYCCLLFCLAHLAHASPPNPHALPHTGHQRAGIARAHPAFASPHSFPTSFTHAAVPAQSERRDDRRGDRRLWPGA